MLSTLCNVFLDSIDSPKFRKKLKDEHNLDIKYVQLDVTSDLESINRVRDAIEKEEGKLDVLVNNAGFVNGFVEPNELTPERMDEILQILYCGVKFRVTTIFIPLVRKAGPNGVILNNVDMLINVLEFLILFFLPTYRKCSGGDDAERLPKVDKTGFFESAQGDLSHREARPARN
ncbi:hypothetical protein PQX77_008904 [Marasmius sp. AFHP31]|nr:hypothetical protein PQX77_008904 [Marasmius sp. AFHP31]